MLAITACVMASVITHAAQVAFTGVGQHSVIEVTPDKSTGLDKIYVLYSVDGVGMTYTADTGQPVTWYRYGSQGGGYAEEITNIAESDYVTTLAQVEGNCGYIIEEGFERTYLWVTNYQDYYLHLNAITSMEAGCTYATLTLDGSGDEIVYYSITGTRQVMDREIELSYYTLVWDDTTHWQQEVTTEKFESLENPMIVAAPLCNTTFTLSGDQFLNQWGEYQSLESDTYQTVAVSCEATAVQEQRGNDNEKGNSDSGLGGSAPCNIVFTGYPTDAVVYRMWEMASDEEFEDLVMQFSQDEVEYTFNDAGTYYMRYRVANNDGSCEYYSETFTITVGESELVCPNVFSPGTTEGVNDVWKVSYKSLVEFHCWIFNRWGNLVKEFTDPGDGWDGTYHGKLVPTGTYYYVVTAVGSDGVKYKKRGDINILNWKKGSGSTTTTGDTTE